MEFEPITKKKTARQVFAIAIMLAVFLCLLFYAGVFETWEWRLEDKLFVERVPDTQILIVAIDDASLQEIGRWPWDRKKMAELVERISVGEPRVLGIDVNFPEAAAGDDELAASLERDFPVVLPAEGTIEIPTGRSAAGPIVVRDTLKPIAPIAAAVELGLTNTPPDRDGIVRKIPEKVIDLDGNYIRSFGSKIAALADPQKADPIVDNLGRVTINYVGKTNSFSHIPAEEVFRENFDPAIFRDKIILVGATAPDLHDTWLTPTAKSQPMPGIEIHANLIETILEGDYIVAAPDYFTFFAILSFAVILALSSLFLKTRWNIIMPLALALIYIFAVVIAFEFGLIINILYPLIALAIIFTALAIFRYVREENEKRTVKKAFEHYLSPHVIQEIMKDPTKLSLGGVKKEMTVLFSDIRGFTTLSEGLSPEELTDLMNKYLTEMTNIVLANDGVLDKYIGDALMAFWGAPLAQPRHAERACKSALRMIEKLGELNASGIWPEGRKIAIGIGINTGEMVVGNMGAEKRFDYTVLGDAVNLGSRVESINKQYGTKIIITEFTKEKISDEFVTRYLDRVAVKGKSEPVKIYELICYRRELELQQKEVIELYEEAFALYQKKKWDDALAMLRKVSKLLPDDLATKNIIERCEYYKKEPPPKDWEGAWVMKTK